MTMEQLMTFCSKDEVRHALMTPFVQAGDTYATDGRIMIRIPGVVPGCTERANSPNAKKLLDEVIVAVMPQSWPVPTGDELELIAPFTTKPCKDCDGTGKMRKCAECNGEGVVECDYGHEHDCPDCDGRGYKRGPGLAPDKDVACDECDGTGKIEEHARVDIGGVTLRGDYVRKMAALPNCRVGYDSSRPRDPVRFDFEGGVGALMPMQV